MELRHLQHFIAVAEELNFTRAAERIHIVQSALSSSIRSLENELKAPLLVRSTRQVQLTPAGIAFLERAREAIRVIESGFETVADIAGLRRGSLSIGTVHTLPAFLDLPSLMGAYHEANPGIEVRMRQADASSLIDLLRSRQFDLAFLPLTEHVPDDIMMRKVACEDLVVAVAPDHPLAGQDEVKLSDLASFPFVDFEAGWGTRLLIDRAFAGAELERRTAFDVTDLGTIVDLTSRGLGISMLPETIAEMHRPRVAICRIAEPPVCWELVVAFLNSGNGAHSNGAANAFLGMLTYYP